MSPRRRAGAVRMLLAVVVFLVAACGSSSATPDGAGPDATPDGAWPGCGSDRDAGVLGRLPQDDETCASCGEFHQGGNADYVEADRMCAEAYPWAPCPVYCPQNSSECALQCAGECRFTESPPCRIGDRTCAEMPSGGGVMICDEACADGAGGCRECAFDAECEADYGAGALCQRHCGRCCVPDDPELPCSCA